jgi:PAS domain S-box-containing protein
MDGAIEGGSLGRSAKLLEAVCNNATVALFIMDERQHCIYMNPAAEALTGFTLAEVQGRLLHDVVHHTRPDGTPFPYEECPIGRAVPGQGREQGEEVFVHKDGHFIDVAYTASPIRDGGDITGTVIEVIDITQRKQAQAALHASERLFRNVFNQQFLFAAILDPQGRVREINDLPLTSGGLTRDEVIGKPFRDTPWWDGLPHMRDGWEPRLKAAAKASGPQFSIDDYRTAGGGVRQADCAVTAVKNDRGEVDYFIIQASDITDRVTAREAAASEERQVLTALYQVGEAFSSRDLHDAVQVATDIATAQTTRSSALSSTMSRPPIRKATSSTPFPASTGRTSTSSRCRATRPSSPRPSTAKAWCGWTT